MFLRSLQSVVLLIGLVLLGRSAAAAEPAESTPILRNGDFENDKKGWWGDGKWDVVSEPAGQGKTSLKVQGGYVCQDKIKIQGATRYKISMLIKSVDAPDGSVFVQSSCRGAGVPTEWFGPTRAGGEAALLVSGGTHDWKPFSVVVETPEGANQLVLYLRKTPGTEGVAYYDSVAVTPTDELLTPQAEVAPTGEMLKNGNFEAGKAPWWGQGKWDVVADAEAGNVLRVESGFVCQDRIAVKEKQNYRISMKIRSDGAADGTVFVQTAYRDGSAPIGSWHGPLRVANEAAVIVTGGTHKWKPFSIVVSAPPAAKQILLYLRKKDGPGMAYYDDVKIEPTEEKAFTLAERRRLELAAELLPAAPADADTAAPLAGAISAGTAAAPAETTLAESGRAVFHLHVGSDADVVTLGAVRDLAGYLKQIAGADFAPLSHDRNCLSGPLLVVGRDNALAEKLCSDVKWDDLGDDGFVIRSAGQHVVLAGATPRGTMYAVNWFLDRQLGVKWLSPKFTFVPQKPHLKLPALSLTQRPHFSYREVLSDEGSNPAFAARNLLNGRSHGPSFSPTAPEVDCWVHDWMAKGGSANFLELLPQKTYGKDHPDWYHGGQVAMMNKEMRAAMAKEVVKRLKAHPDYTKIWFNIWQMDWGWDMDPASKAFADAHGGHPSAPRLDMMIDIADRVRAELPGARMAFNAYSWGFTPPEGMTVPDHILVFPMTIHVDYSTPLYTGRNKKLGEDMVGWTKIARNVQVWDHITNWAGFLQPTPNIYPIADSIQWLSRQPGFRGYFVEGDWNSPGGEFSSLRAWLIGRLTWDPTLDPRQLVDEYCRAYFGEGGPVVMQYIDLMHAAAAKSGDILGQRFQVDIAMYDLDFVTAADALFDKAEAAVANEPETLAHVRQARMGVDYVILIRRNEYAAEAAKRGVLFNIDAERRRARFDQAVADNKVTQYHQGGKMNELATLMSIERTTPAPHPMVKNLPESERVEIQDLAFSRFGSAAIVADPVASDGAAIRMSGKSSTWAIQLVVEKLPKEGKWDLYADVRVEAEPGHEAETGVRVGSSPPMGLFNTGKIGELNDGKYHLIKVPGGPHQFRADARLDSIYIQSPAKPYINYVYLDRIVAIRHRD